MFIEIDSISSSKTRDSNASSRKQTRAIRIEMSFEHILFFLYVPEIDFVNFNSLTVLTADLNRLTNILMTISSDQKDYEMLHLTVGLCIWRIS